MGDRVGTGTLTLTRDEKAIIWREGETWVQEERIELASVVDVTLATSHAIAASWMAQGVEYIQSRHFSLLYSTASGAASLHVLCPEESVTLLWACGIGYLLRDSASAKLASLPRPPEVKEHIASLMLVGGDTFEDPVEAGVDELLESCSQSSRSGTRSSRDQVIVLLKRCIGDYRATRTLRLGNHVRCCTSESVTPGILGEAMHASVCGRALVWNAESEDGSHVEKIFPYADVADLQLGWPAEWGEPAVDGGLFFTLLLKGKAQGAYLGAMASLMSRADGTKQAPEKARYCFAVDSKDELFLWVRGLSIVLEEFHCASKFSVSDIHKALD